MMAMVDDRIAAGNLIDDADDALRGNARDLERELNWLTEVLSARFALYFDQASDGVAISDIALPDLSHSTSPYGRFVTHYQLSSIERLAVILALSPHLRPQVLDVFFTKNRAFDRRFSEFGGVDGRTDGEFVPTGETLAFVVGGNDLQTRFALQMLFDGEHYFYKHHIFVTPHRHQEGHFGSLLKIPLTLSDEYLSLLMSGRIQRPRLSTDFPAQQIDTPLTWDDLILHPGTRTQIAEIQTWLQHGDTLMNEWGMAGKLRPGYRTLFYGPPGTGKTMTACLLGKTTGREVYKIDLSLIVSKYIGETEKNLAKVFDQAQHKGWILFFDEADALFGKRTQTKNAHDRYANQEVSFLLQRIETFDSIAILASNLRENLDDAFMRRFESVIYFPLPRPEDRVRLWRQGFSPKATLDPGLDLNQIGERYALSGGSIMNVIRYASLEALKAGNRAITADDVVRGARREYTKEGKGD